MKLLAVTVFAVVLALSSARPQQSGSKFDNVDVDAILKNDRIVNNYIKCLLDKGSCTGEGRELKRILPDAIKTDCSQCSQKQKKNTEKVIKYLKQRKSREWRELITKYDPQNVNSPRYL